MLLNLNIKNLAVFDDVSVNFNSGFNVITGETGSGKSILIEAMFLLIGARASKELIRNGCCKAVVSGVFDIADNKKALEYLDENNIKVDENDFLLISRDIRENGKTINKINNIVVSINILKELGKYIVDIYGQFEQQAIYKKENHINLLDNINSEEINKKLLSYGKLFREYNNIVKLISELEDKLVNKELKLEQYNYELNEIDDALLEEMEEDRLIKQLKKLSNVKEIKSSLLQVEEKLIKEDNSAINNINNVYSIIEKNCSYDDHFLLYKDKLDIVIDELQNLVFDIINYYDDIETNDEEILNIENRVSLINRLKRKYGYSIGKIFEYRKEIEEEIKILSEADNKLQQLNINYNEIKEKLCIIANEITLLRNKNAKFLEVNIVRELEELNMKNIKFKVKLTGKKEFTLNGRDEVEFLISTNIGDSLNLIHKVVSGGEASRIMLALKKLSNTNTYKSTMVFDEIDSGISGKTSQMAGNKMKFISTNSQIICVTHSPQIASISESHFFIEKLTKNNITTSVIKKLNFEEKVLEIARILSGMNITTKSVNNARELIRENNIY